MNKLSFGPILGDKYIFGAAPLNSRGYLILEYNDKYIIRKLNNKSIARIPFDYIDNKNEYKIGWSKSDESTFSRYKTNNKFIYKINPKISDSFVFGSCRYIEKYFGIFDNGNDSSFLYMKKKNPACALFLGDNIYADADYSGIFFIGILLCIGYNIIFLSIKIFTNKIKSYTFIYYIKRVIIADAIIITFTLILSFLSYYYRYKKSFNNYSGYYRKAFSTKYCKHFLSSVITKFAFDDHEYYNNFYNLAKDLSYPNSLKAFDSFAFFDEYKYNYRAIPSNKKRKGKRYYNFDSHNTSFFVLDTRTDRELDNNKINIISKEQQNKLIQWVKENASTKKYLVVASSTPIFPDLKKNSYSVGGNDDNWSSNTKLRKEIITKISNLIKTSKAKIIFIGGDYHKSGYTFMDYNGIRIHSIISSPIKSNIFQKVILFFGTKNRLPYQIVDATENYRVSDNSMFIDESFAHISFSEEVSHKFGLVSFYNKFGKKIVEYPLLSIN